MESFPSGKIGRDVNAIVIVNSKPRLGGQGRNACSLFMGLMQFHQY